MPHLIRSACMTDYINVARSVGLEPDRMVEAIGLPNACLRNPDLKISLPVFIRLLETSAKAAKIDNFGLRLSERRLLSNLGPLGLIAREQPTVRKAIEALSRYSGLHSDGINLQVEERDDLVIVSPVVSFRRGAPMRQATELSVGVVFRFLRISLGDAWKPQFVSFTHSPPKSHDIHRRTLGSRVKFGQGSNAIVCRIPDLEAPMPASDPVMARYIQHYLELIDGGPTSTTTSTRMREFVRLFLPAGRCSIEHIAKQMGVDRRTIGRRLDREGTTFSLIVEGVRAEMVECYLEDPNRPLFLIAQKLGFSALSTFSRWFRDRYGCSASRWRADSEAFKISKSSGKVRG
jgi:AraC-like DNA-binding protein